jgi:hypothetical protein
MTKKVARDTPLIEITLRRYEKQSVQGRELVRKLCLSTGLLQPGDSRDVVVDVLMVVLKAKKQLTSEEIAAKVIDYRRKNKIELKGIAGSNIRRQLLRLRNLFLVEKVANEYRITENDKLLNIFGEKVEKYLIPSITDRVKEYLKEVDKIK